MEPASLLVLIAATAGDPAISGTALEHAIRQTLGAEAIVQVEVVPAVPSDDAAIALAERRGLQAIAEVSWRDGNRQRILLHVSSSRRSPWLDREIGFTPADAAAEEARTIGFVLASMLPEQALPPEPITPLAIAWPGPRSEDRPVVHPESKPPRGALEAGGLVGAAFGGYGGGFGGAVAGEWLFARHFGLRLEGSVLQVNVPPASGPLTTVTFGGGLAWHAPLFSHVGLGARADLLAMYEVIVHFDDDEPHPLKDDRWLPAADAFVDGTWSFSQGSAAFLGAGLVVAMGETEVFSHERLAATLPPLRGLAEAGIRVQF